MDSLFIYNIFFVLYKKTIKQKKLKILWLIGSLIYRIYKINPMSHTTTWKLYYKTIIDPSNYPESQRESIERSNNITTKYWSQTRQTDTTTSESTFGTGIPLSNYIIEGSNWSQHYYHETDTGAQIMNSLYC